MYNGVSRFLIGEFATVHAVCITSVEVLVCRTLPKNYTSSVCLNSKRLIKPARATVGAVPELNVTVCITGRSLSCLVYNGVSRFLIGELATVHAVCITSVEVLVLYHRNNNSKSVKRHAGCIFVVPASATICTSPVLDITGCLTGGLYSINVSQSVSCFLIGELATVHTVCITSVEVLVVYECHIFSVCMCFVVLTCECLNALICTSRSNSYNTVIILVSKLCYLIRNVTVATYRTSVSCIATVLTVGIGFFCIVLMSELCYLICNVAVATYRTSVNCIATVLTVGIGYFYIVLMSELRYLVFNVAVATYRASISCITTVLTVGSGYNRFICMSSGRKSESCAWTVCVLNGGVILNLNVSSILREIEHSNHSFGSLSVFGIHSLRIYKNLSYLISVNTGILGYNYVIRIRMTAYNHCYIRMLAQELIPKLVSGIIVRIICCRVSLFTRCAECSVTLHIVVSGNYHLMVGMSGNNLVCPHENVILSSVVETKEKIINATHLEGVVNVIYSPLFIISCDIVGISLMICKVLIEEFNTIVTVATNKGIRDLAVHKRDCFLCGSPLSIRSCFIIVCMSDVHTVLGYIAKTYDVLNVFGCLIIKNPLIDILKKLGVLVGNSLSITYKSNAIRIVVLNRLYVLCLPKKLLVCRSITVA